MNRDRRSEEIEAKERERQREELDEVLTAFRLARRHAEVGPQGWLRTMRHAIGVPAAEVARRMGVTKRNVMHLEESERDGRIELRSLQRMADAMDCELVYAVMPYEGRLGDMGARREAERMRERMEHKAALRTPEGRKKARAALLATREQAGIGE